jgi:NodT family efflux transporter outer membrane factor (OMF) lipoprotein
MRRLLAVLTATTGLTACAAVPNLGPAPEAKPIAAYSADRSFQAPAADWPADRWWDAYGDAQLSALVEEALRGAPTLKAAEARARRAEALAEQQRAAGRPQLGANASAAEVKQSYNNGIPPQFVPKGYNDTGRATLDLNWDLDLFGRNRAAVAAAVSESEAARLDAAEARLMLAASVVTAYADLGRLFGEREAAAQALASRASTADLTAQRVREGVANQGEQSQAEAARAAAAQDVASLDEQIALGRNRIAALLGQGPDRGLSIQPPPRPADRAFGLPPNLAADLVGRRPDVQAARLRAEAAASRVKAAKAGFYPNINLAAFIGVQSLKLSKLTDAGSDIGQAQAAISLPIFSAGRLEGAYRGARAEYDAAVADYDQAVTLAFQEAADAVASQRALAGRLAEARRALAAAEDAQRIAALRYRGGLTNYLAALTADDAVAVQRRTVADLEAHRLSLDAALARALGGGFRAPPAKEGR